MTEKLRNNKNMLQDSLAAVKETVEKAKDLDKTAKDILQVQSALNWHRQFSFKMQKADENTTPKQLDDLYKSTRTLIQGCLGEDLGQAVLADSERWNKIRDHVVVHQITDVILKY
ncbi:hypothetical protein BGZ61DRAFT_545922 [Ilyonectria robusta]|uniref:uncharacterized protein n=1 Tax=Ilyonectria robusta TaxID=1079257 RepID=UPI001E8DB39B|nr:uncharacterized protein BGZ61DRAFT_545922 [Ilyonectria robusta]KAH8650210.1 hypothetical protein BGZ61DRAFT_545922 [Ilyonectria robusta]